MEGYQSDKLVGMYNHGHVSQLSLGLTIPLVARFCPCGGALGYHGPGDVENLDGSLNID